MEREGVEGRLGCEDILYIGAKGIGVGWEGRHWVRVRIYYCICRG